MKAASSSRNKTTLLCPLAVISLCLGEPLSWVLTPKTALLFLTFWQICAARMLPSIGHPSLHIWYGVQPWTSVRLIKFPTVEYASTCSLSSWCACGWVPVWDCYWTALLLLRPSGVRFASFWKAGPECFNLGWHEIKAPGRLSLECGQGCHFWAQLIWLDSCCAVCCRSDTGHSTYPLRASICMSVRGHDNNSHSQGFGEYGVSVPEKAGHIVSTNPHAWG